ncbi:hypothetical protein CK203_051752 [Vitis vinifera]|uniref:PGG domain-containing protein n=1 Tax=Vitis vinifera TaxID=29760 RepID=A0A438HG43_VITVI|nr:hypothetical protein CK203_051752 [Vitis vinifera]
MHLTKPLNKDNQTAEELFAARNERLHRDAKEWLMRTTENCTILSIFIATVAFAAAYTVPGGPNQDTGIPILNSKPFFVVFILADVFSLTLALTSVAVKVRNLVFRICFSRANNPPILEGYVCCFLFKT